ncbi:hypothetical protein [Caulobacter sp. Root342]|uniref:hypothetical protein n=1 Tax=Caulobacter sp. Root342 TaxID=1736519 RepID=UPI000701EC9E|nr:hypothetical protein [Caulobacter sp. Root342]KQV54669.1 hypothetical protein ASC62_23040 [Caulobacter sp. Root342]
MRSLPAAHARAITNLQADYRRAQDPFTAAGLDHAIDLVLNQAGSNPRYLERNARRDGRSLAIKRKRRAPLVLELDASDNDDYPAQADRSANPEREAIFKSELRRLEVMLREHTGRARELLECWANEMSVEETAVAMNLSPGRVKQLRRLVKAIALQGLDRPF